MARATIELSVHQLVDFLLRKGDIDNRVFNRSSMQEGTLLHALYQSKQGDNYISEYALKRSFMVDGIEIILQGRADGIIKKSKTHYIVDEIKTTVMELEEFRDNNLAWHLGQAKCYAYMFAKIMELSSIDVRLTYIKQGKDSKKLIEQYTYQTLDLEKELYDLLEQYVEFYNLVLENTARRDASIKDLEFPFDSYRDGQKELAKYVYSVASHGGQLFVEAPTGIGKTMSTLFPYIKFLPEKENNKIFYLTAKATGKESAHHAISLLRENNLYISNVVLTSKDKICFCKDKACNPDECPFTKGYYNKIKDIIKESILRYEDFDYETICHIAKKYSVCPFELELDLSLYTDVIICDYNYVFDPISYLKRYFDDVNPEHLVLVDEAHNLVDRSREMYTASISYKQLEDAKYGQKKIPNKRIKIILKKIENEFENINWRFEHGNTKIDELPEGLMKVLERFVLLYQEESKAHNDEISKELTEFYLEINKLIRISDLLSDRFLIYVNKEDHNTTFKISCLDASRFLAGNMMSVRSTVLFSATLSPMKYYVDVLGGSRDNPTLTLASPFPKENLKILVAPKVSTRYKNREKTYSEVARYLESFVSHKKGNYFIYLPSYEYLDKLQSELHFDEKANVFIQTKEMTEQDRKEFIDHFREESKTTNIALAIIGGAFGEGIDLVGDSLIGVAVVGIGLPKINYESNQIVERYKLDNKDGFAYAYIYPGMNKVMQAVGRVIRSEKDRGVALLIDERYMWNDYKELFKKEWSDYEVVLSTDELQEAIQRFFKK